MTGLSYILKLLLQWLLLWQLQCHTAGSCRHLTYATDIHLSLQPIVDQAKDTVGNLLEPFRDQYKTLSPKGKFVTGAVAGIASSKVVVRTSMKAIKYTSAVIIITEVLSRSGVLDEVELSEESNQVVHLVRQKTVQTVAFCRDCIHKHATTENLRNIYEYALKRDKMTTMGFATGAAAGLVW